MNHRFHLSLAVATVVALSPSLSISLVAGESATDPKGTWELAVEWPQGTVKVELEVRGESDELAVRWRGPRGELEGREVDFTDDELSFTLIVGDQNGNGLALQFRGKVAGDKIDGRLKGPGGLDVAASGQRGLSP